MSLARAQVKGAPLDSGGRCAADDAENRVFNEGHVSYWMKCSQPNGVAPKRLDDCCRDHCAKGLSRPIRIERSYGDDWYVEGAKVGFGEFIGRYLGGGIRRLPLQRVSFVHRYIAR